MQSEPARLRIPELRLKTDRMTQAILAKESGLSKATISNLESGRLKRIELETIAKLCKAFACQPNDLFELPRQTESTIVLSQRQALKKVLGSLQYNKAPNTEELDKDLANITHQKIKTTKHKSKRRAKI